MKNVLFHLAACLGFVVSSTAIAEELNLKQLDCPARFDESQVDLYKRSHDVLVISEPQPTATVSDSLQVLGRDEDSLCFSLVTVARNYHQCGLMGVARAISPDTYVFEFAETRLVFTLNGQDSIHVVAVGDGYKKSNCGFHGAIEPGIFAREAHAS